MDLEQWSVGGRGFGSIFVFLLMAGEIYSTFTFLGGAGLRLRLGRRRLLHPRLRDARLHPLLLAAARRLALRDAAQAAVAGRLLRRQVRLARARRARLGRRRRGDDPLPRAAAEGPRDHRRADVLGHGLRDRRGVDRRGRAVALRRGLGHPRLGVDGGDQGRPDALVVVFIGLYLPIHYFGSIGEMFHQVQDAKPGFAALKGDQLTPVWFSSTVLLTALGFYMWPHTFGSALTARDEDVFRRNAIFMPLYQLLIAFVLLVGFVAVLRLPDLPRGRDRPRAARRLRARVPGLVRRADRLGGRAVRARPGLDAADRVGDHGRAERLARASTRRCPTRDHLARRSCSCR